MRNMTAETMMQANGGKYRYMCDSCHAKFRTGAFMVIHILTWHAGFSSFHKI
ncbi:MAG: hypothetical protein J5501_06105 [Ruminococcus sp.]|nr:hypothetical protein [Ruminococcus sp.]